MFEAKTISLKNAENSGQIGPRLIEDFELQDVPDDGNCFYYAVLDQLLRIDDDRVTHIHDRSAAVDYLRQRVQRESYRDREWATTEDFMNFLSEFPSVNEEEVKLLLKSQH
jgi:hypothetical protein